uniref:Uncharacterized protein n=1 Tax=Romanomermis culicivorax TaxID=13658 RepID=A0A915J6A3_ROMCU
MFQIPDAVDAGSDGSWSNLLQVWFLENKISEITKNKDRNFWIIAELNRKWWRKTKVRILDLKWQEAGAPSTTGVVANGAKMHDMKYATGDFVAVVYDSDWFIAEIIDISDENSDYRLAGRTISQKYEEGSSAIPKVSDSKLVFFV